MGLLSLFTWYIFRITFTGASLCAKLAEAVKEDCECTDSDCAGRHGTVAVEQFYEETIPRYSCSDFKSHFRMNRSTFQKLAEEIMMVRKDASLHVPVDYQLYLTLWLLGNLESFRGVADRFNCNKGNAHFLFMKMCKALSLLQNEHIIWPSDHQAMSIQEAFRARSGFPGVIGAVDGCHIPIKAPEEDQAAYINRKSFHSIILQGVADHMGRLLDINVGWPGSVHDARVFRNSNLASRLLNGELIIPRQGYLVGDSAYPLCTYLMVPFKDNGHLTEKQVRYNKKLSSARSAVERCFGRLKGKFRRLRYLDMSRTDLASTVIAAACVLHNFILKIECDDEEWLCEDNEDDDSIDPPPDVRSTGASESIAKLKRRVLSDTLG